MVLQQTVTWPVGKCLKFSPSVTYVAAKAMYEHVDCCRHGALELPGCGQVLTQSVVAQEDWYW